jgi:histidine triad (HIT) family protein
MILLALLAKIFLFLIPVVIVLALIEYTKPLTRLILKLSTPHIKKLKVKSLSAPSPFELTDPSLWLAESANAYALKDIRPRAPHHYLIISKQRTHTLLNAQPELLAEMLVLCQTVAQNAGIKEDGFRIVINTNPQGMQTVYHLHMHLIGGRQLGLSIG